jgi:hypothetical protein
MLQFFLGIARRAARYLFFPDDIDKKPQEPAEKHEQACDYEVIP